MATSDEIVGELHYRGDIRGRFDRQIIYTERYGPITSIAASYDEDTNLTTILYTEMRFS